MSFNIVIPYPYSLYLVLHSIFFLYWFDSLGLYIFESAVKDQPISFIMNRLAYNIDSKYTRHFTIGLAYIDYNNM